MLPDKMNLLISHLFVCSYTEMIKKNDNKQHRLHSLGQNMPHVSNIKYMHERRGKNKNSACPKPVLLFVLSVSILRLPMLEGDF